MIAYRNVLTNEITVSTDEELNRVLEKIENDDKEVVQSACKENTKEVLKELLNEIYKSEYKELVKEFINEVEQKSIQKRVQINKSTDLDQQIRLPF